MKVPGGVHESTEWCTWKYWVVYMKVPSSVHESTEWCTWKYRVVYMIVPGGVNGSTEWCRSHESTGWCTWKYRVVYMKVPSGVHDSTGWCLWKYRVVYRLHESTGWCTWRYRVVYINCILCKAHRLYYLYSLPSKLLNKKKFLDCDSKDRSLPRWINFKKKGFSISSRPRRTMKIFLNALFWNQFQTLCWTFFD